MRAEQMALVQGWDHTKASLRDWHARPSRVLVPWMRMSLAVAILMLLATYVIAKLSTPDPTPYGFPGVNEGLSEPASVKVYGFVLFRNSLVLLLHALACVAGFIAGSSLPQIAGQYKGWYRKAHEIAQPAAIAFVIAATVFSLATQAYFLGGTCSSLAYEFDMTPGSLLAVMSLHAIPELTALFLPLAAWTMASRRGQWQDLLAATFATTAVAVPMLLIAAAIEVWGTPHVINAIIG